MMMADDRLLEMRLAGQPGFRNAARRISALAGFTDKT